MTAVAEPVSWPTELGPADGYHPWWCRRLDCATGHRSQTVEVGGRLVWATATVTWATTVHEVGAGPLTGDQVVWLRMLRRAFADPADAGLPSGR